MTIHKNDYVKQIEVMVVKSLNEALSITMEDKQNNTHFIYNIRHGDNSSKPAYLEHKPVRVNRYGYCISKVELPEMPLDNKNFKYKINISQNDAIKWLQTEITESDT